MYTYSIKKTHGVPTSNRCNLVVVSVLCYLMVKPEVITYTSCTDLTLECSRTMNTNLHTSYKKNENLVHNIIQLLTFHGVNAYMYFSVRGKSILTEPAWRVQY